MGRNGSFVDNAGAGGIFGAVDVDTGKITAVADENQHHYTEHPDTHVALIEFCVPQWEEACAVAKRAAQSVPEATFVGWDLAYTDRGWIVVEGNHCPLIIYQIATERGLLKEFDSMRKSVMMGCE